MKKIFLLTILLGFSTLSFSNISNDYISSGTLASGTLQSKNNHPVGEGMIADWQNIHPNTYGQPISFSIDLKATNVKNYTALWLRFDGKNGKQIGPVHWSIKVNGTRNWTTYPLRRTIPKNAKKVVFGVFLAGAGRIDVKSYILNK